MKLLCSGSVLALAFVCAATPAWAQGASAPQQTQDASPPEQGTANQNPAQASAPSGVAEIIVTAQRRSESVQHVPISITAVTGESLIKSGVTNLNGLQRLAPGLSISTVGSGFVSYTYIRGGGTNQGDLGSDPSVAYFVDEIYLGGTAGLQTDLFDIDHVEVLKGPQGTLFGRNASSGAISIVTKRPSATFDGDVHLEGGSYGNFFGRGGITGPLTSDGSLLYRVSVAYHRRDPIANNLNGTGDPGAINSGGVRGQLEYNHENVTFLLTGDFYKARNGMTNSFLSGPSVAGYVDPTLPEPTNQSFFRHYYDLNGYENQDLKDVSGRLEWRTPIGTVTSISAHRDSEFRRLQDQDATLYNAFVLNTYERDKTFSQELRLAGDAATRLHYVLGLYYYHADSYSNFTVLAGPAFPTAIVRGHTAVDLSHITTNSYAAFGQIGYDLTDKLTLTLGGRYTSDHKEDQRAVQGFLGAPFSVDPTPTFHNFSPAVTLSYKPTTGILAYSSYRRGFKSGGFQSLLPSTAALAAVPFLPEEVASYEAGLKTTLFDRRVVANIALFRSDITNQQVSRNITLTTVAIDNAGQTRADGIDLQLTVKPVRALTLSTNITAQRARFQQYQSGATNFAGNHQLRSPDFSGYFAAEYAASLGQAGMLTFRGEYSYQTKIYFNPANASDRGLYQPGYGLGNLRVTYTPSHLPVDLAVFVNNVGDKHYAQNIAISGPTGVYAPGDPRTVGAALNYHF